MKQSGSNRKFQSTLSFVIALLLSPSVIAGSKGVAYVSNQDGAVTVIDLDTMEIKAPINIEAKGPRGIGVTADGKHLITANQGDSNISVVDLSGSGPTKLIPIGKNPEFVRVLGDRVYIAYEPSSKGGPPPKPGAVISEDDDDDDEKVPGRIAIVDLNKGKVIKEIVGKPETEGLEFSKDGKKLIVTNESDNSVTVHNIKSGKLLKSLSVGKYGHRPRGIKISPDGKTYLVTLELSDKMLVLDSNFKVIKEVNTGKTPYGVSYDREGKRIFVAANNEKALQVFDAKTYEKIKDIPSGERCWHFSFTPDDQQLLLACGKSKEVIVIDANTLEVTKRITGLDKPWGIVTYPKSTGSIDLP
jgi:YVTN family beta-propeller protein